MAKSKKNNTTFLNRLRDNALVEYLRNTRAEMRKVHWPTREEAKNLTKIVLAVTIAMSVLMGVLDYLFALELRGLLTGNLVSIGVLVFVAVAGALLAVMINREMI